MKRSLLTISACLLLSACAHFASSESETGVWKGYFPEDVKGMVWANYAFVGEPRFYTPGATKGYKSRHRLLISGITCINYVIRIDETVSGGLRGIVKHRNRCRNRTLEMHRFSVPQKKFAEITSMIKDVGMFEFYPETWGLEDEDAICIDGHQLLFERRDASGYGISESNAQCTSPAKVREIAKKFIALSGEKVSVIL